MLTQVLDRFDSSGKTLLLALEQIKNQVFDGSNFKRLLEGLKPADQVMLEIVSEEQLAVSGL